MCVLSMPWAYLYWIVQSFIIAFILSMYVSDWFCGIANNLSFAGFIFYTHKFMITECIIAHSNMKDSNIRLL